MAGYPRVNNHPAPLCYKSRPHKKSRHPLIAEGMTAKVSPYPLILNLLQDGRRGQG